MSAPTRNNIGGGAGDRLGGVYAWAVVGILSIAGIVSYIDRQIINLLMKLQREFDLSLVFISHDLSVVRHISHRIMVLYLGKLVEVADRDSLYDNPRHPYTQALISAVPLPDPDAERAKRRIVLTGDLPSPVSPPSGCYFRTRCPKVTDRCAAEEPPLHQIGPGHRAACHYWDTPMPVQDEG